MVGEPPQQARFCAQNESLNIRPPFSVALPFTSENRHFRINRPRRNLAKSGSKPGQYLLQAGEQRLFVTLQDGPGVDHQPILFDANNDGWIIATQATGGSLR